MSLRNEATAIKTLAIFDLETTGLVEPRKISELTILAVSVEHFLSEQLPRVQHKLTICFNPEKEVESEAAALTGLSSQMLQNEEKFDENAASLIGCFIKKLQQPVCLVAHNGDKFDFPILKKQLGVCLPANLKRLDSINFFRFIDPPHGRAWKSYKQTDIYKRFFNEEPRKAHDAESDVITLLKCISKHKTEFVDYTNNQFKEFN